MRDHSPSRVLRPCGITAIMTDCLFVDRGSIPRKVVNADLTQLVECHPYKMEVGDSSSSIRIYPISLMEESTRLRLKASSGRLFSADRSGTETPGLCEGSNPLSGTVAVA